MEKIVLITGGSSGIGECAAKALHDKGCRVYELSRRDKNHDGIVHISADVTDEEQVKKAVEEILAKEGRIDVLINNAGFGISGAIEFTDNQDAKKQLEVNLFGMVNMIKCIIPAMRKQGGGKIVNMSSVAACVPIPFQAWYSISKAMVNSLTMTLANELRPFNIDVCAIMPGDIKTGFTQAREKTYAGDDIYSGRINRSVATMEKDEQSGMNPMVAGKFIAKVALKKRVKPQYTIGIQYKLVIVLIKLLPARIANWIIGMLYAK